MASMITHSFHHVWSGFGPILYHSAGSSNAVLENMRVEFVFQVGESNTSFPKTEVRQFEKKSGCRNPMVDSPGPAAGLSGAVPPKEQRKRGQPDDSWAPRPGQVRQSHSPPRTSLAAEARGAINISHGSFTAGLGLIRSRKLGAGIHSHPWRTG